MTPEDEVRSVEMTYEWARAFADGQSFGPWAYHGCAGRPPYPADFRAHLCDRCRDVWDLAQELLDREA